MANFHLRDVPEPLYEKLQARAKSAGRSLNRELLHIVAKDRDRGAARRHT
jgi:plasmid stability protein